MKKLKYILIFLALAAIVAALNFKDFTGDINGIWIVIAGAAEIVFLMVFVVPCLISILTRSREAPTPEIAKKQKRDFSGFNKRVFMLALTFALCWIAAMWINMILILCGTGGIVDSEKLMRENWFFLGDALKLVALLIVVRCLSALKPVVQLAWKNFRSGNEFDCKEVEKIDGRQADPDEED